MKKLITILIAAVVLMSMFSCSDITGGLFYSIEQESEIYNGSLPDDLSVGTMFKNDDYYFIAAGNFRYIKVLAEESAEWTIKNPVLTETLLCQDFIIINNSAYAVFYNTAATAYYSYKASVSNPEQMGWEMVDMNIPDYQTLIDIETLDSLVFLYTVDLTGKYHIHTAASPAFSESSGYETIISDLSVGGELAIDTDSAGNYWLAAGNKIYRTDGTLAGTVDLTPVYSEIASLNGNGFPGIVCVDTDTAAADDEVYISSDEGLVLERKSGAWTVLNSTDEDGNFELLGDLYGMQHAVIAAKDIDIILIASENGYYEMNSAADLTTRTIIDPKSSESRLTETIQYSSIDLSDIVINDFFIDPDPDSTKTDDEPYIFALCYRSGLWKNSLKSGIRFWDKE